MFYFKKSFKAWIENRKNNALHTESLRIKITKNKIIEICEQRYKKEENDPYGYDIKASCCAIGHYKSFALDIQAPTIKIYMEILNKRVDDAQNNCDLPGEYSGGVATYGTLNTTLQAWYEDELRHSSLAELVKIADLIQSPPTSKI